MSVCDGCAVDYFACISDFRLKSDAALAFFRKHGVLPAVVTCPRCDKQCALRKDKNQWHCRSIFIIPKKKKKRSYCNFTVSDFKGTFLEHSHLPPWKVLLFLNHWLSRHWDHKTVTECMQLSLATSVAWRLFCSKVTDFWFEKQESIGGEGVVVEIDKAFVIQHKQERGRVTSQVRLFGGIERVSKKKFVVPLEGPAVENQDKETFLPLILKFVRPGSVVISDQSWAYNSLEDNGYTHHVVSHSEDSVDPADTDIHTKNIERLWRSLKEWVTGPGLQSQYFHQYLARYLFVTSCKDKTTLLHRFLIQAAQLFPPVDNPHHQPPPPPPVDDELEAEDGSQE